MSGVEFRDVSFRYPTSPHDVLKAISVHMPPGELTWLFGPLGAGTTTLLLVAAGLAPRHTGGVMGGRVSVLGGDPHSSTATLVGRVGYVTANPELQLSGIAATVWEEVAFAPANLGWPLGRIQSAVASALQSLGVAHLAERRPQTLSGGELQRTAIAAMKVLEPAVWLLDEPLTALDAGGRAQLLTVLRDAAGRGATIVVASEDADAMATTADRLLVLRDGAIVLDGDPMSLLGEEAMWAGGPGSTAAAEVAREARRQAGDGVVAFGPPYPVTVEQAVERWA